MRKIVLVLVTTVVTLFSAHAYSADKVIDAYIDNNKLTVELLSEMSGEEKALFLFYDKYEMLIGVTVAQTHENCCSAAQISNYSKIKIWITDLKEKSLFYTLNITVSPSPVPSTTPLPSAIPAEEPVVLPSEAPEITIEPEEEYSYHGTFDDDQQEKTVGTCSITIDCSTALNSTEIDAELLASIPLHGIMCPDTEIEITEEMTVYDALLSLSENNGFTLEGDSSYISGINGLSEFDCGPLSGWLYSVNGEFTSIPINECKVNDNDRIKILYTCNLGIDVNKIADTEGES